MFWEFFTFELKFRFKSLSTYIYFAVWFAFSFLGVASESFGPIGNSNGKVLLNGPYANIYNDIGISFFGIIIIAAIFGTSILRDFQRDTIQILFTKPISKFAYLGGRWAGSFVATVFAFSGLLLRRVLRHLRALGRPRPHRPQSPLLVSAAVLLHRRLPDLLPRLALLPGRRPIAQDLHRLPAGRGDLHALPARHHAFSAPRARSNTSGPASSIPSASFTTMPSRVTGPWSNATRCSTPGRSHSASGVFLYNRLLWGSVGLLSLVALWKLFPMSVEALTARSSGKRAALARAQELTAAAPRRSLVAAKLAAVHQVFGPATTLAQFASLTRLRISQHPARGSLLGAS